MSWVMGSNIICVREGGVTGISPYYRGRNGPLLSIGQKGRFLLGKILKIKIE